MPFLFFQIAAAPLSPEQIVCLFSPLTQKPLSVLKAPFKRWNRFSFSISLAFLGFHFLKQVFPVILFTVVCLNFEGFPPQHPSFPRSRP